MATLKVNEIYAKPASKLQAKIVAQLKGGFTIFTRNRGDIRWTNDSSHLSLEDASEVLSEMLWG